MGYAELASKPSRILSMQIPYLLKLFNPDGIVIRLKDKLFAWIFRKLQAVLVKDLTGQ
jgi:hypothetical protein